MDARTGLGRFKQFRISNYELMMTLIDACATKSIKEILALPDVAERTEIYEEQQFSFLRQLDRCCTHHDNLIVIDLRAEKTIFVGNRFTVYALNPTCNISMHLAGGRNDETTMIAVGKSIFNRTSSVDVGALMLEYGGGGHLAVGTCQVPNDQTEEIVARMISILTKPE
jgi:nanoRNase/pAp phosphatase (c-di-AMP/oligoRNAs hydrolase)